MTQSNGRRPDRAVPAIRCLAGQENRGQALAVEIALAEALRRMDSGEANKRGHFYSSNPLSIFPKFSELSRAADNFVAKYCDRLTYGGLGFSAFRMAKTGVGTKLKTETILSIIGLANGRERDALFDNYSAFNRGPQRSVIALMMIHDLRNGLWHPEQLTAELCAQMYDQLGGSYQTPKVIQLYAQQCFGSPCALPIDNWVSTFLRWPLEFNPASRYYENLFSSSELWGKVERLIWLASQARKVHSSVAADILWCIRFGGPDKEMRGANPLGCKICADHVRRVCPAFDSIKGAKVYFNRKTVPSQSFNIRTSSRNNVDSNQVIETCRSAEIFDAYSTRDRPEKFFRFPISGHDGSAMTVKDFIEKY